LTFKLFKNASPQAKLTGLRYPWLGKVENVRIVTAADRAKELNRDISTMKAAYYYSIQSGHCHKKPARDVSSLVGPRPSKPAACTLAELARCKPVSEAAECAIVA
jgi:site-specific recombinase XerD